MLSSHSRLRREVVPSPPPDPAAHTPPSPGDQLQLALAEHDEHEPTSRKRWAWLLKHVFKAELDTCPRCGGPMRWLEAAMTPNAARNLLARLRPAPRPPPIRHTPPFGQLELPFRG